MRMCKTISFNSWNEYFKAPFGALKTNEGAKIRVNSNSDNVYSINLIIEKEKEDLSCEEIKRIKLATKDNKVYEGEIEELLIPGIYYYYFEVEINKDGRNQKLFYGKVHKNGEVCQYAFENLNKYMKKILHLNGLKKVSYIIFS